MRAKMNYRNLVPAAAAVGFVLLFNSVLIAGAPCLAPDNGSGTADLPADCPYDSLGQPFVLGNTKSGGTGIDINASMRDLIVVLTAPGGNLGGEIQAFVATMDLVMHGTGALAEYKRTAEFPVVVYFHAAPRKPGESVQSFDFEVFSFAGNFVKDDDFCNLAIQGGSTNDLPAPGHTVLTLDESGDYVVSSQFELSYEFEYEGCPGSPLEGFSGTSYGNVLMQQGIPGPVPAASTWALIVMGLLSLTAGTIMLDARRPALSA